MKILFTCKSMRGGGAQKLVHDISILMQDDYNCECEVLLLTSKEEVFIDSLKKHNIHVEVIPQKYKSFITKIYFIANYAVRNKFDIIHANMFPTIYFCSLAKKTHLGNFPKLIMTEHNTDNNRRHHKIFRYIDKFIYRSYDHVISISEKTQEFLLDWIKPKDIQKYSVVHNGIVLQHYIEAQPYPKESIIQNYDKSDVILVMVGAFKKQKNHDLIIDVMELLPDKYKLVLVGVGNLCDEIKRKITEKNLNNRITFLGFRKDVAEIMHTADIIVIPSRWEGFGLVAAEAMACGKAIVATNVPGLSEVLGDAALKVPLDNPEAYSKAIMKLEDKTTYTMFCKKAAERSRVFSIGQTVKSYHDIFNSLLHA